MSVRGKIALITGAGSGIGKAAALRLAQEGAIIGLLGRTENELAQVERQIKKDGGEAVVLLADVANADETYQACERLAGEKGRIDIVFANAGVNGVWAPLDELSVEEFEQTVAINLTGTFTTLKFAYPHMKQHGGAMIITASVNGTRIFSNSGATAYSCTKAAQVAMGRMLALELAKHKIRVNTICPGAIETSIDENTEQRHPEKAREPVIFPEGRIPLTDGKAGTIEQVADLVLFLASDASSHISGTEVFIDGAQSLLQG